MDSTNFYTFEQRKKKGSDRSLWHACFTGKCVSSCKAVVYQHADGDTMLTMMHIANKLLLATVINGINIADLVLGSKWVQ